MPETMATTGGDVLLYIPNLIGYARVLFTTLSLVLMISSPDHWILAIVLYVASFVGDLFDGMAARRFDQCSVFGGLLDMVTDRCSTAGLLCVLSHEYSSSPSLVLVFIFLIILDISSHWCQMYSTTFLRQHHKSAEGNKGRFFLVRWFYLSYPFFGYCCVGAEFTYVALYVLARVNHTVAAAANEGGVTDDGSGHEEFLKVLCGYFLMVSAPACVVKQIVNVSQLCSSCYAVAAHDAAAKNKK